MAKYVDIEPVVKQLTAVCVTDDGFGLGKQMGINHAMEIIAKARIVDAVEVVHSFWDDSGRYVFPSGRIAICCDICKCALSKGEYHRLKWNYCPVCGAKMDLESPGRNEKYE